MSYVLSQWSFDPFLIVVAFVVAIHEIGLGRLRQRADQERTHLRRRRSLLFYGGLLILLVAVCSPIDYYASDYFFIHMIEHILIMFFAPILIVGGAPWVPLLHGVPVTIRRPVLRTVARSTWFAPIRALRRFFSRPVVAIVTFNVIMVVWHIPRAFDAAEENQTIHIWLMHGSLFLAGIGLWLQIVDSPPFRTRASTALQIGAIIGTNVVMFVLAMSMSIFTAHAWYSPYAHVPGVTLSPFADQQIGAAVLWVCGDFWALPALLFVIRRAVAREESLSDGIDRLFHRDLSHDATGLLGGSSR